MPEREMNPSAGRARRFTITADTGETAVEIELPSVLPKDRQPHEYKVVKKDIPDAAKNKTHAGKIVIWINNYGIRLKGKFKVKRGGNKNDPFFDEVDGEQFSYEVIVPGPPPAGYQTLVYFDGTNIQPASATYDGSHYHFSLSIGDPATGWGG